MTGTEERGAITYRVSPDEEEAFIQRFQSSWTDEQFDFMTSGYKSAGGEDAPLPDADSVDPQTQPEVARRILLSPQSKLEVRERPFVLPLLRYLEAASSDVPPDVRLLAEQYDLFLVRFAADAQPVGKERIRKLRVRFGYPTQPPFLTLRLIPDTVLEQRFAARNEVTLGLRAGLTFDVDELASAVGLPVTGAVEAGVNSGFIYRWTYQPLHATILASGQNSSFAAWELVRSPTLIGRIDLAVVLCTPKGAVTLPLDVQGSYELERGIWWWQRATTVEFNAPTPLAVQLPPVGQPTRRGKGRR